MNRLTFLVLLVSAVLSLNEDCAPNGDWDRPNLKEQVKFASVIFEGEVIQNKSNNGHETQSYIKVIRYLKGCGPDKVIVNGFDNKDSCKLDPPLTKIRIRRGAPRRRVRGVYFVCNDEKENEFRINDYTFSAGMLQRTYDRKMLEKLTEDEFRCVSGQKMFTTCKSRTNEFINEYLDKETITVHTREPIKVTPINDDREMNRLHHEYSQYYQQQYPQYFNNVSTQAKREKLNPFSFIGQNSFSN